MKTFEVRFSVDGKSGGSTIVEAPNTATAKRIALGEIQGQPGYMGKRISGMTAIEIR